MVLLHLNIFWIGLLLYSAGSVLNSSTMLNGSICQAIQTIGLICMLYTSLFLIKKKIDSRYLRVMLILYVIWHMAIIFRGHGLSFNYSFMKEFLFGVNSNGIIYFIPLIVLFPRNFAHYKALFQIISISAILFLIFCLFFIKKLLIRGDDIVSQSIIENNFDLGIPAAFILLTYLYHSGQRKLLALATIAVTFFFCVIRARRGLLFITGSLAIYSFLFYFLYTKRKLVIIYFSILFALIFSVFYTSTYNIQNNKLVRFLAERGTDNTRTAVEFFFYEDMKPDDWLVGRGIGGTFFCPECDVDQVNNNRPVIETGFLQLALKGGLISLGLILAITFPAAVMGIFFSRNLFSKAAGIWIFQFIVNLYPQNSASFNLSYFIVWISVAICYSGAIRKMTNIEIAHLLSPEKRSTIEN